MIVFATLDSVINGYFLDVMFVSYYVIAAILEHGIEDFFFVF